MQTKRQTTESNGQKLRSFIKQQLEPEFRKRKARIDALPTKRARHAANKELEWWIVQQICDAV